ncbi:MAG: hypothetical protein WC423_27200, partial [Vulcanimicrobiota bacterium]
MFGKVWILILLVLVLSFRLPLLAQSPTPEEDILNASGMMKDGFYSDALDLLNSVSQNHAGTEYDAWSRMEKAFLLARAYRDYAGAQAVTESIVNDFPKTEFYLVAKENLLDLQLLSKEISIDAYLEHLDLLIQETGGAGLWVDHHIVSPVSFLEPVAQEGYLGELYFAAAARTAARPKEELTPELLNKAERLARFYRNEFSDSREAVLLLERIAFARSGQDDYTPKPMDSEGPRIENLERSTA